MAKAKNGKFTIRQFNEMYPDDDTCLNYMFKLLYGHLEDFNKYYRIKERKAFVNSVTGHQISPLANTIFHKSRTKLKDWFFVVFMFGNSKNGVSAKEVERALGVTYKCAWRICQQVRKMFAEGGFQLEGVVEADETFIGGKAINKHKSKKLDTKQTTVLGAVERQGRVVARVVDNASESEVKPFIRSKVMIGADLMTDESPVYDSFKYSHNHKTVNHSQCQYVDSDVYTNTIEGFWSQLKRSIDGTFHMVSDKYLQSYVNEFAWRYNNRNSLTPLFFKLIKRCK